MNIIQIKRLLTNKITIFMYNLMKKNKIKYKNRKKNLKLYNGTNVNNCTFGLYNTIYNNSSLLNTKLGDFTYIAANTNISNSTIGKYCSIGGNCLIGMGSHPTKTFVSTHPIFFSTFRQTQITFADKSYYNEYSHKINIGNDVWIGVNVLIPSSVNIGNGVIIAAGSVVTKNIPDYAIVGGVPAKIIKYRFNDEEIKYLLKIKWWDKKTDWLKKYFKTFHNIKTMINEHKE